MSHLESPCHKVGYNDKKGHRAMRTSSKILLVAVSAALATSALAQTAIRTVAGLGSTDGFHYALMTFPGAAPSTVVTVRVRCIVRDDPARGKTAHCEGKLE